MVSESKVRIITLVACILIGGCIGVINPETVQTTNSTRATGDTPVATSSVPTSTSSARSTSASTTGISTLTGTSTTAESNERHLTDSQSVQLEEFLSYTDDNPGEIHSVRIEGDELRVNYSIEGNFRTDAYYQALRNYLIDFATVVRHEYNDNSSEPWKVDRMVAYVSHPNGTLSSRYYVYDYWEILRVTDDDINISILTGAAGRTISFYSAQTDSWQKRTIYMPQFRERVDSAIEDNVTLFREQTTIFVRLNSTAESREALDDQLRTILAEYAELHDFYYNPSTNTYDTTVFTQPFVLEIGVRWEGHGEYLWGRISGYGAHRYESGTYDMDHYLQDFLNSSVRERGRLRDQP